MKSFRVYFKRQGTAEPWYLHVGADNKIAAAKLARQYVNRYRERPRDYRIKAVLGPF